MLKKLRIRFVAVIMAVCVVLLGVIFGTVIHFDRMGIEQESLQTLQAALAGALPNSSADDAASPAPDAALALDDAPAPDDAIAPDSAPALENLGKRGSKDPFDKKQNLRKTFLTPYLVLECATDGTVQLVSANYGMDSWQTSDDLQALYQAAMQSAAQFGTISDYGVRFLKQTAPADANPAGAKAAGANLASATTRIAFVDSSAEEAMISRLIRTCLAIGLACLAVLFVLAVLFARWAVRPVEHAWKQQTQFVSDASHELKTPVAVILANAELLNKSTCTEEQRKRYTGNILSTTAQMKTLVNRLLELARFDNASSTSRLERVDLSECVQQALLPFEPLYFERGLTLNWDIQPNIAVMGDAAKLAQIVDILLDNAQKYSSPQGKTVVQLAQLGKDRIRLTVKNEGGQLSAEELGNLFDRFYRADSARTAGEGYGLGLAIAHSVAAEHGGRIWATSEGGWNTFHFEMPPARP